MRLCYFLFTLLLSQSIAQADLTAPLLNEGSVFGERNGRIAVEAEFFYKQSLKKPRAWYRQTETLDSGILPDGDPIHTEGASGDSYLEILPDTRRNHGDKLTKGVNFQPDPGKQAILSYKVRIKTPGRYYVWVRTFSTNTEDNGLHVGLNGTWPESGARLQWTVKDQWRWDSKQRTEKVHTGVDGQIWLDIAKAGDHTIQFSMREDGFEFDKFILTRKANDRPQGLGPAYHIVKGPKPVIPIVIPQRSNHSLKASDFSTKSAGQYIDQGKWLAVHPDKAKSHLGRGAFPFPSGKYNLTLHAVGENDGQSRYTIRINGVELSEYIVPLSKKNMETGPQFTQTWNNLEIDRGDVIEVDAHIGSVDGKEYARARWSSLSLRPADKATKQAIQAQENANQRQKNHARRNGPALVQPRQSNGDNSVEISGERKQWQPITLTLDGPFAHEQDRLPNPFTDYNMAATFTHSDGTTFTVPGYFAADGNAAETSAESGTKWRAHLAPSKAGKWTYQLSLFKGTDIAYRANKKNMPRPVSTASGSFTVAPVNAKALGFYVKGRLQYTGQHYLHFAGTQKPFFKVGADAPETLLAFADFDGTVAHKPKKSRLKQYKPHLADWQASSPTWKSGKGKGLIGAIDYLSGKGVNAMSFLTYNAGGDGDNVWPFTSRNAKFHYDCSKLDQWNIVFSHAQAKGIYLHFKTQETENDDNNRGHNNTQKIGVVPTSLDGGDLGFERKLYYRELIARFGHHLALNWNIGEENTQTTTQQLACARYIADLDAYDNNIVIHTFPGQQNKVYRPLIAAKNNPYTGASLQNDWSIVHRLTLQWVRESSAAGKPWIVANDEQNSASAGCPPDIGYKGFTKVTEKNRSWDMHDIRKNTLWGNLMAGGAGVEYYFGYKLPENDLVCEDWRSRDKTWEYGAIAIRFFEDSGIPFASLKNRNDLVGNQKNDNSAYCLANDKIALVFLPKGGSQKIHFPAAKTLTWFNPRTGESGETSLWASGKINAPDSNNDWLAILK